MTETTEYMEPFKYLAVRIVTFKTPQYKSFLFDCYPSYLQFTKKAQTTIRKLLHNFYENNKTHIKSKGCSVATSRVVRTFPITSHVSDGLYEFIIPFFYNIDNFEFVNSITGKRTRGMDVIRLSTEDFYKLIGL